MASYELLYFPARGRAEQIRTLLAYKGVDFTESCPNWAEVKPTTPFGRLPIMNIQDEGGALELPESGAIMRYLGQAHGMYGSSAHEGHMCEALADYLADERGRLIGVAYAGTIGTTEAEIAKFWEQLPATLDNLERALGRCTSADSGWFIGAELTFADISAFDFLDHLRQVKPEALDSHPKLQAFVAKVRAEPALATFLAERQRP